MQAYKDLLVRFADLNRAILGENLVGVYLHGSSVMDCFNPKVSDLDLLIVVKDVIPDDVKWLARYVLLHRIYLTRAADVDGITVNEIISEILDTIEVP